MNWKFWQGDDTGKSGKSEKLSKPRELPQQIGGHLIVNQKLDPDWVWSLKCLTRKDNEKKHIFHFRIYDPKKSAEAGIKVTNYYSLEDHQDLVIYRGKFNKNGGNPKFENDPLNLNHNDGEKNINIA